MHVTFAAGMATLLAVLMPGTSTAQTTLPGDVLVEGTREPAPPARSDPDRRRQQGRGQLFISPMGEPFRADRKPGAAQALWFAGADRDDDGRISLVEFQRDAMRVFAVLHRRHDGEIDPSDIDWYENVLVPEIRVRGGARPAPERAESDTRGGSQAGPAIRLGGAGSQARQRRGMAVARVGAGRFGFFDLPEPVTSADLDFNRGVDRSEFDKAAAVRFAALDRNRDGMIARGELPRAGADTWRNGDDQPETPTP